MKTEDEAYSNSTGKVEVELSCEECGGEYIPPKIYRNPSGFVPGYISHKGDCSSPEMWHTRHYKRKTDDQT